MAVAAPAVEADSTSVIAPPSVIDTAGLQALIDALRERRRVVLAPTVRDGTLVHAEISSIGQLPRGWGDEQAPGTHRLRRRGDDAFFGLAVGAQSWKSVLFPARELLWRGTRTDDGFTVTAGQEDPPPLALLGVRSCDLHAIRIHDTVLLGRPETDVHYRRRRRDVFVVAVACSTPGGTCFCASTGTGPQPDAGFDLALTELLDDDGHRFVVQVGSPAGAAVLADVPTAVATGADLAAARAVTEDATARMGRTLDTTDLRELLYDNAESPRWAEIAERCLACANCTLVCPTCFCTSVEDVTDLTGTASERWRAWDSCFTGDFSYIHGGSVRSTVASRYRQWMTHKLAAWVDQFGTAGCVGCGRCVTWCPVGIDITEEAGAIRENSRSRPSRRGERHAHDG